MTNVIAIDELRLRAKKGLKPALQASVELDRTENELLRLRNGINRRLARLSNLAGREQTCALLAELHLEYAQHE